MADDRTSVAALKEAVRRFAAEREWERFHSPKDLSMSLACEAAELMEHFLWVDADESRRVTDRPEELAAVAEEVADVACLLFNVCVTLGLDLSDAVERKMAKNALKYPVEKYRGKYRADGS